MTPPAVVFEDIWVLVIAKVEVGIIMGCKVGGCEWGGVLALLGGN